MIRIVLICLVGLTACSVNTEKCTDVNQDKIYQTYSATYKAHEDTTSVSSQFRFGGFGGTTLELDGSCAIKHDTFGALSKGSLSGILGTSYTGSKSGYLANHKFTFTNNAGKVFENSLNNSNAVSLPSPPSTLSKTSLTTITFSPAIAKKESVSVYIDLTNPPETGARSISATTDAEGATSVEFTSANLTSLSTTGSVSVYAVRTLSKSLDQASASEGGEMWFYYYSAKSSATLQ